MPTYEMLWDCGSCGTRKLLGKTHRRCPQCGAAQDARKRYFPPEGEEVAVEGHVYVGIDWACGACRTPNSRAAEFCVNCGHPRDGNADVALVTPSGLPTAETPSQDTAPAEADLPPSPQVPHRFAYAEESSENEASPPPPSPPRRWPRIAGGISAALASFFAVAMLWTENVEVVVTRHDWVREIEIERMAARAESAWCDSMPGDAYGVSRSREQRGTREVADGEECDNVRRDNGDGTFSTSRECRTRYRSEPVYDDRCRYTVNRWGLERTAKSSGAGLIQERTWPAFHVSGGSCMGCEREGQRREKLTVAMRGREDGARSWTCEIDDRRWRALGDGQWTRIKVRVITGSAVCDSLQP
jgi:hypothetical protein